jgi:hypothetical protein
MYDTCSISIVLPDSLAVTMNLGSIISMWPLVSRLFFVCHPFQIRDCIVALVVSLNPKRQRSVYRRWPVYLVLHPWT